MSAPFLCESCQKRFELGEQVQLDGNYLLPMCALCWNQLSVAERLAHCDRVRRQCSVERLIETVCHLLEKEIESRSNPFGVN